MMTPRFLRPLFAAAALAATLTGAAAHAQQAAATAAQTAPAAAQPILNIGQIHDKLQAAGYTDIREIELEKRGFYEVKARDAQGQPKARDAQGQPVKLHVSAATGEVARSRAR